MTSTLQRRFDLPLFSETASATLHVFRRPLARMDAVKAALRCDEDHVLYLLHDKQLHGFDLRGKRAGRCVPGVWYPTLHAVVSRKDGPGNHPWQRVNTEEMINDILPARPRLRLTELTCALTVVPGHVHHWIRDGLIQAEGGDRVSKAPLLRRDSVVAFLKCRRL